MPGSMRGRVMNEAGAGIPDVKVTVFDDAGNTVATAVTAENGQYAAHGIPPGTYSVSFKPPAGFLQPGDQSGVEVEEGRETGGTTCVLRAEPSPLVSKVKREPPPLMRRMLYASAEIIPVFLGLFAVALLALLMYGFFGPNQIGDRLADVAYARGLITFFFAVGTIGIGILLVLAVLLGEGGQDSEKRFSRGKEVLTLLIGVLGTIVGFYFGSSTGEKVADSLTVAEALVAVAETPQGAQVTLTSVVVDGEPPYKYSITFDPNLIDGIENRVSKDGWITESFTLPPVEEGRNLGFEIRIEDANGVTATERRKGGIVLRGSG